MGAGIVPKFKDGIFLAAAMLVALPALGADVPSGYESYSLRPKATQIHPQAHTGLMHDWTNLKRAHLEAVAMLLEMYPDREIYFLARDSELLYDLASWEARGEPALSKRLHLLNISRANMKAEHVQDYLAQEGISQKSLQAGKKILFVDTGFSGTIPRVIEEYFPENLRTQFATHLMASANPQHPSSRGFLTGLNPAAPSLNPGSMHGTIVTYEHMPRYTERSDRFVQVQGRWQPISKTRATLIESDGEVDAGKARRYMEDLLHDADRDSSKKLMAQRRDEWRKLRALATHQDVPRIREELKKILQDHPEDPFAEAMVRDFIDMASTHHLSTSAPISISAEELGLSPVQARMGKFSNKNELIKKYPAWAPILEDPATGIKKLIETQDYGKLGAITDAIYDDEFMTLLCKSLGEEYPKPGTAEFMRTLIEKGDPKILRELIEQTFLPQNAVKMKDLVRLTVENADQSTLVRMTREVFSHPGVVSMKDSLRAAIKKADSQTLGDIASRVFSQPHAVELKDELQLVIELGDQNTLYWLSSHPFRSSHVTELRRELRLALEKADQDTITKFAGVFERSSAREMTDEFRLLIEKANPHALRLVMTHALRQPETPSEKIFGEACAIENQSERIAFLKEKLGPSLPHTRGCITHRLTDALKTH